MTRTRSHQRLSQHRNQQEQRHHGQFPEHLGPLLAATSIHPEAPTPTARHTMHPPVRRPAAACSLGVRRPILARLRRAAAACMDAQGSTAEGHRETEGPGYVLRSRPIQAAACLDNRGMKRNTSPAFFTERSLAAYLAVSDRTIRNWIRRGELPSYKLGAARRIDPADVDAFLAQRREEAA